MAKKKQQQISPEKLIRERGRSLEIYECLMDKESMMRDGESPIIVTRKHKGDKYTSAFYLVDSYCTGVKDTFYKVRLDEEEYRDLMRHMHRGCDLEKVDYVEAHNWIFGAIEFAAEAGINPHKDFAVTKWLLEDDEEDTIPIIEYEFGKDGKHHLVTQTRAEANKYLPILRANLGDVFTFVCGLGGIWDNEDCYDPFDFFSQGTEDTVYKYDHPEYPTNLTVKNEKILQFMDKWNTKCPTKDAIDEILKLDRESLINDLHNIILYDTGQSCCEELYEDPSYPSSRMIYSLILLGEVGSHESIDVILETLRQNEEYMDFHFGDYSEQIFTPVLCKLAKDNLGALYDYLQEPNRYTFAKSLIFPAVYAVGKYFPEKKSEAIKWFKNALNFIELELYEGTDYCDSTLAGFAVHHAVNLAGKEFIHEIEMLYETECMDPSIEGTLEDVLKYINSPESEKYCPDYTFDIYQAFQDYAKFCKF